jgi:tetratricopeptide (TPR) repeat protein/tRNA A-37 threonylcarbamoyl transferase component Bud32
MATFPLSARAVFDEALEIASPDERRKYLERACAGAPVLRLEVEALLSAYADAGSFLETPAAPPGDGMEERPAAERPGTLIGRYELLHQIGEGGMGVVWLAEQTRPVQRKVALKVIKPGMDSRQVVARFEVERQALAVMDHVNIARVLDGGATEAGLPYFVMELVHGVPITQYCDDHHLTPRERLELFVPVCQAIQHAHQKGIIHRDIKPSNVMVTLCDGRPVPKVIDFGVAKATEQTRGDRTLFTQCGTLVGTLEYMSPEQAEMSAQGVDTRSDIYSLGVLLYELLTGSTPLTRERMKRAAHAELLRMIKEEEPPKPSTRLCESTEELASISANRQTEPAKLTKLMRGDLDWILLKCLEKDRTRRYETANGLAVDILRHLSDETVSAGAPSAGYRLTKFVRRNRARVIAGGIVAVALVLGVVGTTSGMIWALEEKNRANVEANKATLAAESEAAAKVQAQANERRAVAAAKRAETISEFVTTALKASDARTVGVVGAGQDMTILTAMHNAIKDIDSGRFKNDPETEAGMRATIGTILESNGRLAEAELQFRQALEWRRSVLGDEHPDTLRSINNMGGLLQAQGKPFEAEPYYREALETRRRVLGDEHHDTLTSINYMGDLLQAQGQLAEAEPFRRDALEGFRRVLGNEHPDTLIAIGNMGDLLQSQGKWAEAEPYCSDALERLRLVLGDEYPSTLTAIGNMGTLRQGQGRLTEAEPYFREALEKSRRALGIDHPATLTSMNNLGNLLREQGKLAEAEPYTREALEGCRRVLGDEHPNTLTSTQNMGNLLQAQRKLAEAEPYFREALEKRRRVLGDEHFHTLSSINSVGNLLQAQGKLDEAEPYYREALEKRRRVLGDEHPSTLASISNMGSMLRAQDRLDEAEPYYRDALDGRRRVLGDEHADTLTSINNLGNLLRAQSRLAEAEPLLREALERNRRVQGDEHPSTLTSINNMGALLRAQGKLAEAEPYYREALEKRRRVLGDESPQTLTSIGNMGSLLQAQNRLAEAEPYYDETLETSRRIFRGDHPVVADALNCVASVRQALGRAAEAEPLFVEALEMRQRLVEGDHADVATQLNSLARARQALGKTAEARQGFDEAVAMLRRLSPDGSPLLARVLWRSGSARFEDQVGGGAAAALPELEEALTLAEKSLPPEDPQLDEYRETLAKCRAALAEQAERNAKHGGR